MGIYYCGLLCVGYTYEQAQALYEECLDENDDYKYGDFYEFCENEGLESFSPHFDADKEYCIYGTSVAVSDDYCYEEVTNLDSGIQQATEELKKRFCIKPKAYIMSYGC